MTDLRKLAQLVTMIIRKFHYIQCLAYTHFIITFICFICVRIISSTIYNLHIARNV